MERPDVHGCGNISPAIQMSLPFRSVRVTLASAIAFCLMAAVSRAAAAQAADQPGVNTPAFPVSLSVDAGKKFGAMRPIWRYFGADEPNYAYMKDGSKLLSALGKLGPGTEY